METKYNVTDFIIKTVYDPLKEFVEHYETHGMSLPPEFASDPGAWLVILKEIEYAFDSVYEDKFEGGFDTSWMTPMQKVEHDTRVSKGLELFGKHLMYLWD
jgi:hypothetical protein